MCGGDSRDCDVGLSKGHLLLALQVVATPSGILPNSGIELRSPASQADSLLSKPPGKPLIYNNMFESTEGEKFEEGKCDS